MIEQEQLLVWISASRFEPFLRECGRDYDRALSLYRWHAKASAACFETLHHFEVLFRNVIDRTLSGSADDGPVKGSWLVDFELVRPEGVKQVIVALQRLGRGHKDVSRGRVVAALPFGFWKGLFGGRYEEVWRQHLRHGFPNASRRKDVSIPLEYLHRMRNRIAHHDSILGQDLIALSSQVSAVADLIDYRATLWLDTTSRVRKIAAAKPVDVVQIEPATLLVGESR